MPAAMRNLAVLAMIVFTDVFLWVQSVKANQPDKSTPVISILDPVVNTTKLY